jgi:hypothetical protein
VTRSKDSKPSPVGPPDVQRVVAGTAGMAIVALLVTGLVRSLPAGSVVAAGLSCFLGMIVIPVVASPIEWFVHRFVYHDAVIRPLRAIYTVHTAHHYAFFPTWRYTTLGPARRLPIRKRAPDACVSPTHNALVRLAHFSWYMGIGLVVVWAPAWFATHNVAFIVGLVIGSAIVSNLFIVVHDTIHRPGSHRLVEAQPWFAFLDRHHYIHHVDLGANLNFLLPLADLLFGTLRTEMTADELDRHGSIEAAKLRPIGHGERARAIVS